MEITFERERCVNEDWPRGNSTRRGECGRPGGGVVGDPGRIYQRFDDTKMVTGVRNNEIRAVVVVLMLENSEARAIWR